VCKLMAKPRGTLHPRNSRWPQPVAVNFGTHGNPLFRVPSAKTTGGLPGNSARSRKPG
jgi:hypothetical protein